MNGTEVVEVGLGNIRQMRNTQNKFRDNMGDVWTRKVVVMPDEQNCHLRQALDELDHLGWFEWRAVPSSQNRAYESDRHTSHLADASEY